MVSVAIRSFYQHSAYKSAFRVRVRKIMCINFFFSRSQKICNYLFLIVLFALLCLEIAELETQNNCLYVLKNFISFWRKNKMDISIEKRTKIKKNKNYSFFEFRAKNEWAAWQNQDTQPLTKHLNKIQSVWPKMGLRAQYHLHKHFSRLKAIIKYLKGKLNKKYFFSRPKSTPPTPSPDPWAASFTVGFISFMPYGEVATAKLNPY